MKLTYEKVTGVAEATNNHETEEFSLAVELDTLNQEAVVLMGTVERTDPTISDYLKLLDSKINAIAYYILMENNALKDVPFSYANVSASGLGFVSDTALEVGTEISLKFLLASCMNIVECHAKVTYCNAHEADYSVGVEYIDIKEEDSELLIKHVVKQQMHALRETKKDAIS